MRCKLCGKDMGDNLFDTCYSCMARDLQRHYPPEPKLQWPNYEEIVAEHEKRRIAEYNPKPKRKVEYDVSWA